MNIGDIIDEKPEALAIIEQIIDTEVAEHEKDGSKGKPGEGTLHSYLWNLRERVSYLKDHPSHWVATQDLKTGETPDISQSIALAGLFASFGSNRETGVDFHRPRCLENIGEYNLKVIEGYVGVKNESDAGIEMGDVQAIGNVLAHLKSYSSMKYAELMERQSPGYSAWFKSLGK